MRFISTKTHGALDYSMGTLLIILPWLMGFARGGAETYVPVILGAGAIIYSLFTNYELGLVHKISMPGHLALDAASGFILALSPWLFGFADLVWAPHAILGLLEIAASATTKTVPESGLLPHDRYGTTHPV